MCRYELWMNLKNGSALCVNITIMGEYELWVGDTNANKQTHSHINTMTQPGLRTGLNEKQKQINLNYLPNVQLN